MAETVNPQYREHLQSRDDLVTLHEATRTGFIALALERNRRASPFIEQAKALRLSATRAQTPLDLLRIEEIQAALLTASGISDKAKNYLDVDDQAAAILALIRNFLEPAGASFVDELVYRFLLTRGDTLGGSMRNVGGILAQQKFIQTIVATLRIAGREYQWLTNNNRWIEGTDDLEIRNTRGLMWTNNGGVRTLLFNLTVPLVKNNIDLCLLDLAPTEINKNMLEQPEIYLALGELKGGIDPAGADEHWKTARSALTRIRDAFSATNHSPNTFFVGAAIEKRMADEIWTDLENRVLANAANLTSDAQLASLVRWLVTL